MDLVSFETQQEYDWVKGFIDGGVKFFWTSGRKFNSQTLILKLFSSVQTSFSPLHTALNNWCLLRCNFDGCDKPEFFPKLINGWFWSANQVN